ncbi:MAG: haloacid dehalogenase-like hydrolase [Treponema sp.]
MSHTISALSGNWEPQNKDRLEKLCSEKAFAGNYAVFDWDFTCIFYDVQDSLFLYQLENLCFKLSPELFSQAIRSEIPQDVPFKLHGNHAGKLTAALLSSDLDKRYNFLYHQYTGLNGSRRLDEIQQTAEYADFKVKMLALMQLSFTICPTDIAHAMSTGMTREELSQLTHKAIADALSSTITREQLTSPAECAGEAGVVHAVYQKGIRLQPEIQALMQYLQQHGIEPYICSASQEDTVRVFASSPQYGYGIKPENVFGRRRMLDAQNRFTASSDRSIPQTWKEGKAAAIRTLIAPRHGNRPPILIAGDSDGDVPMMNAYKDAAVLLIFDRGFDSSTQIYPLIQQGIAQKTHSDARILVQHRNEAEGVFQKEPANRSL